MRHSEKAKRTTLFPTGTSFADTLQQIQYLGKVYAEFSVGTCGGGSGTENKIGGTLCRSEQTDLFHEQSAQDGTEQVACTGIVYLHSVVCNVLDRGIALQNYVSNIFAALYPRYHGVLTAANFREVFKHLAAMRQKRGLTGKFLQLLKIHIGKKACFREVGGNAKCIFHRFFHKFDVVVVKHRVQFAVVAHYRVNKQRTGQSACNFQNLLQNVCVGAKTDVGNVGNSVCQNIMRKNGQVAVFVAMKISETRLTGIHRRNYGHTVVAKFGKNRQIGTHRAVAQA